MKKLIAWLGAIMLMVGLGLLVPVAAAGAATPYCGITWGSLDKSSPVMTTAPVIGVRAGQHPCFDRLVIDINGPAAGYSVHYGDVYTQGRGDRLSLQGGASLSVTVLAPAYDSNGHATYTPADPGNLVNVSGYQTFRQVAWAGSFEGQTTIGLGVRARLPFRVFTLAGPDAQSRLVVDVAHFW